MGDTNKRIWAHRGIWNGDVTKQNTTEAVLNAFKAGFDVEIDIRLTKDGRLVTGHDLPREFDWQKVMSSRDRKAIAFHVKEDGLSSKLYSMIGGRDYLDFIIFGVSEAERKTYEGLFGKNSIAFEYNAGDDFEKVFNCTNHYIWIAELDGKRLTQKEIILLKNQNKHLYIVTQECHEGDLILMGIRLSQFHRDLLDGVCTDNPNLIYAYARQ